MNPAHACPIFRQPTWDEVQKFVGIAFNPHHNIRIPQPGPEEWNKDHSDFFLHVLLPLTRPPFKEWAITVEAILAREEEISDGSSVIVDRSYNWGGAKIKDWMGIAHDYIFRLHRQRLPDARGHVWGLFEANWSYFRMHKAAGNKTWGFIYCAALDVGSYPAWNSLPNPITMIAPPQRKTNE